MLDFIFHLPDAYVFSLLSIITIVVSLVAIFFIARHVPLRIRYLDNTGIANTSALISIIYGVLAGLMALYLINNINYTTDAAQREASALANLYRDSRWLNDPTRAMIQAGIKKYIDIAIQVEWPLMKMGKDVGSEGEDIIDRIASQLDHYPLVNNHDVVIDQDMLALIRNLFDARQQRIQMSTVELSPETWIVILIGSILTVAINFLLGMNFYLHMITVISVAIMTSGMVFLLITLDRPYQGEFIVEPDALRSVQSHIEKRP
jgi:hypothetical protein